MKIIGLDVGEKRIGVAKVDSSTKIALPVGFVLVDGSEWQEIAKIANLNNTKFFVLGLPRSNEGNETAQTLFVRQFARTLSEKIPGAKIRFQDESLTSVEAENRLKSRKKKYEKGEIDAEAASIILQDFIENFREGAEEKPVPKAKDAKKEPINAWLPKEGLETLQSVAKKESDKIALKSKKASSKLKKITIFGIPLVLILILGGITAALKIRDHIRAEREEEYRRQEAAMVAEVFNFTIAPGETIFDVKKKLIDIGYSEAEIDEALNAEYDFDFLNDRPAGASLEGYLYGETHEFYADASVKDIITKFLEGTGEVISANNLKARYAEQGLSLFEGITLASVVQKESKAAEMPTVAQVFLTRLNYGIVLGSDVTVSYALDVSDPERKTFTDNTSALLIDSCYNTRLYGGLPCGPISNPGLAALLAVAAPSDTSYLYFLTGDDGVMYYSYTEYEHNQNIYLHCQELCQVSL